MIVSCYHSSQKESTLKTIDTSKNADPNIEAQAQQNIIKRVSEIVQSADLVSLVKKECGILKKQIPGDTVTEAVHAMEEENIQIRLKYAGKWYIVTLNYEESIGLSEVRRKRDSIMQAIKDSVESEKREGQDSGEKDSMKSTGKDATKNQQNMESKRKDDEILEVLKPSWYRKPENLRKIAEIVRTIHDSYIKEGELATPIDTLLSIHNLDTQDKRCRHRAAAIVRKSIAVELGFLEEVGKKGRKILYAATDTGKTLVFVKCGIELEKVKNLTPSEISAQLTQLSIRLTESTAQKEGELAKLKEDNEDKIQRKTDLERELAELNENLEDYEKEKKDIYDTITEIITTSEYERDELIKLL